VTLAAGILAAASASTAPLLSYAVHRGQKGRGSVLWAYLGVGVAIAVGAVFVLGPVLTSAASPMGSRVGDRRQIAVGGVSLGGAVLGATVSIPLFLEWSHVRAVSAEQETQRDDGDQRGQ
jgi:hypothetical protein